MPEILLLYWLEHCVVLALTLWKFWSLVAAGAHWQIGVETWTEPVAYWIVHILVTAFVGLMLLVFAGNQGRYYGWNHALLALPLVAGHAIFFVRQGTERAAPTLRHLFQASAIRHLPLALGLVWGGIAGMFLKSTLPALLLFVAGKLALDLGILRWEEHGELSFRRR